MDFNVSTPSHQPMSAVVPTAIETSAATWGSSAMPGRGRRTSASCFRVWASVMGATIGPLAVRSKQRVPSRAARMWPNGRPDLAGSTERQTGMGVEDYARP